MNDTTRFWKLNASEDHVRARLNELNMEYAVRSIVSAFVPGEKREVSQYQMVSYNSSKEFWRQDFKVRLLRGSVESLCPRQEITESEMYDVLMYGKDSTVFNIVQLHTEHNNRRIIFEFFGNIDLTVAHTDDGEGPMKAFNAFVDKELSQTEYMSLQFRQQLNL